MNPLPTPTTPQTPPAFERDAFPEPRTIPGGWDPSSFYGDMSYDSRLAQYDWGKEEE